MVLGSVLVLCTVSLFCSCSAYSIGQSRSDGNEWLNDDLRLLGAFDEIKTTTEIQQKEYGKESKHDNGYKKKYYISDDKLSWFGARDACKATGMVLASTTTPDEKTDLENYLRDNSLEPVDKYSGYWIGSHRVTADGPWTWESNGQEISHFGWLVGEPNEFIGEDCMDLKKGDMIGWNNYYCGEFKRYICEDTPNTHEANKNIVVDSMKTLHNEVLKISADKENENKLISTTEDSQFVSRNKNINTNSETSEQNYFIAPEEVTVGETSTDIVTEDRQEVFTESDHTSPTEILYSIHMKNGLMKMMIDKDDNLIRVMEPYPENVPDLNNSNESDYEYDYDD